MSVTDPALIATDVSAAQAVPSGADSSPAVVVTWSGSGDTTSAIQYQVYQSVGGSAFDPNTAVLVATTAAQSAIVESPAALQSATAFFGVAAVVPVVQAVAVDLTRAALVNIDWTGLVESEAGGTGTAATSSDPHYQNGKFTIDRSTLNNDPTQPGANVTPGFVVTTPNVGDTITFQYDPNHQAPGGTGPGMILKSSGTTGQDGTYSGSFYVDKNTTAGAYVIDVLVNGKPSGVTITIVVQ